MAHNAKLLLLGLCENFFDIDIFNLLLLTATERTYSVLEIFQQHNEQMKLLIGTDYSKSTYGKYKTIYDHTSSFIKWKYQLNDLDISKLTYSFIADFEFYLKSQKKCNHNSTVKYLTNFRKIVNICVKNNWLIKDPFFEYKMSRKEVIKDFLTEEELQTLISKDFNNERLNQVRGIFIFSCFTGLSYIDAKRLKRSDISIGIDNEKWIFTNRKKTDSPTRIPLLPTVLEIIEKYKEYPKCICNRSLLPVASCGIRMDICFILLF